MVKNQGKHYRIIKKMTETGHGHTQPSPRFLHTETTGKQQENKNERIKDNRNVWG